MLITNRMSSENQVVDSVPVLLSVRDNRKLKNMFASYSRDEREEYFTTQSQYKDRASDRRNKIKDIEVHCVRCIC